MSEAIATEHWQMEPFRNILTKSEEWIEPNPNQTYKQVTVRMWGQGVVERSEVAGVEIASKRMLVVHPEQFIVSRIDARHGASGLIPKSLDGAIVTNDFPVFSLNPAKVLPSFFAWMTKTHTFVDLCKAASEGTTNRVRLKEERFLAMQILLPPLGEQKRIVVRVEELAGKVEEARGLRSEVEKELYGVLLGAYREITENVPKLPMSQVAPLVRRPVEIDVTTEYPELGVRSFGKGTFHKTALSGLEVGSKKLFVIASGDLLFQIVFAWEGAIAIAKPEDEGRFGSHRFLTCVPTQDVATAEFLCFHFLTEEGLEAIGKASPGGAGRNRTLGLEALAKLEVPVPSYEKQLWFSDLLARVNAIRCLRSDTETGLNALLPSILDKAFKGEL